MQFDKFFSKHFKVEFLLHNASRECNFAMGTILGKDFPQALVHTVHSTCACGKPFPMIVPMAKLDIWHLNVNLHSPLSKSSSLKQ